MDTNMMFLAGGNLDPETVRMLETMETEKRERWHVVIKALGRNVVTLYEFFKDSPKIVDADTGAALDENDPRFAALMLKYREESDKKYKALENVVNGVVEVALEFLKPSATEKALFAKMMANVTRAPQGRPSAAEARFAG